MEVNFLDYDPEADELDLLIDVDRPVPAESVHVENGVYIRCEPTSGRIVGAFIRGYSGFLRRLRSSSLPEMREGEGRLYEAYCEVLKWVMSIPERMVRDIIRNCGRGEIRGVEGEIKRLITLLVRKGSPQGVWRLVERISSGDKFPRSKRAINRVKEIIKEVKDYPPEEQAYLLGWVCRLLRYEATKQGKPERGPKARKAA
ncbi:MAG: hypothetical protein DRP95_01715 [Candidatus Latescibacterota bacterium]|nr:MAG: hypothetical protein DRP95_01715 [Candidatus Latescibacterota bacterium]